MYWRGHAGLGLLAYAPLAAFALRAGHPDIALAGGVLTVAFSTLPDVDEFLPIPHRGPTHTLAFTVCLGVLTGGVAALLAPVISASLPAWIPLFMGSVVTATLWSHLAGDVITPMGIRPFRPVSRAHFTLDLTRARNPRANVLLLSAGVLALSAAVVVSV